MSLFGARKRAWGSKGPGPGRVWERVSERLGGHLIPGKSDKDPGFELEVEAWTVTVERQVVSSGEAKQVYTRAHALFRAPDPFRLQVAPRRLIHRVAEAFGRRDVTLGRRDFDDAFTVRCSSLGRVRSLLARGSVVALLLSYPRWSVEVRPAPRARRRRSGGDLCHMAVSRKGLITEAAELEALARLAGEFMQELGRLGIASSRSPEEGA